VSDDRLKSQRPDGLGHWPRGKRRNDPGPRREQVLRRLAAALDPLVRGVRSYVVVAEDLGVSDKTVARWLAGDDWPDADAVERLEAWCADPTSFLRARIKQLGRGGIAAAAEQLGLSPTATRDLVRAGDLDPTQIRALRRWLRSGGILPP